MSWFKFVLQNKLNKIMSEPSMSVKIDDIERMTNLVSEWEKSLGCVPNSEWSLVERFAAIDLHFQNIVRSANVNFEKLQQANKLIGTISVVLLGFENAKGLEFDDSLEVRPRAALGLYDILESEYSDLLAEFEVKICAVDMVVKAMLTVINGTYSSVKMDVLSAMFDDIVNDIRQKKSE